MAQSQAWLDILDSIAELKLNYATVVATTTTTALWLLALSFVVEFAMAKSRFWSRFFMVE